MSVENKVNDVFLQDRINKLNELVDILEEENDLNEILLEEFYAVNEVISGVSKHDLDVFRG